jgi:hypothetical protein
MVGRSKCKAIATLLPYAIQQEQDGQPEMLDTYLRAVGASKEWEFMWHHVGRYASELLRRASPRAIVLVLPHIRWDWLADREDLVQLWATAVSAVPDTEEVASSVVDALLQIASQHDLLPLIPANIWLWLTKQPRLPPICLGRNVGTCAHVVKAVRALKDTEVLKSYFLLVWSQWNHFSPGSLDGMSDRYPVYVTAGMSRRSTSTDSVSILILQRQILQLLILQLLIPQLLCGNRIIYLQPQVPIFQPIPAEPIHYQPSCILPSYVASSPLSRRMSINPESALSHHMFNSSDSVLGHPPSRVHGSTSSCRSSSNFGGPNSVSVRLQPPDSTLYNHPVDVADSVSSRSTSIGSVSISILQVQVLQLLISQLPVL